MPDILSVELAIDDGAFDSILKNNEKKLENFGKDTRPKVNLSAVEKSFKELEKQTNLTRKSLEDIVKVRLDAGNAGAFTKELFRSQEQAKQLLGVIQSTRTALSQTTDKSLIRIYLQDLKAAETELGGLQRKQQAFLSGQGASAGAPSSGKEGKFGKLRGYGSLFREFAPEGVNESAINAASVAAEFAEISTAGVAAFGAIAIAGAAVVKVTKNIREEAERQLKVQEQIQGAINRQIISQQEAVRNFRELLKSEQEGRESDRFLQTGDIDDLKKRRANLQKLVDLDPTGANADQNRKEISALAAQQDALEQKKKKDADDNFRRQTENEQKFRAQSAEFDAQAEKKRAEEIDRAKTKAKELEKVYLSVYDSIAAKAGQNNPFVSLFTEADKSLRVLRENTKGLSKDLIQTFEQMQAKQNDIALFSARLDNRLNVFDLHSGADNFRNAKDPEAGRKRFNDTVSNDINLGNRYQFGGTYGSFLANGAGGTDKLTEQQKRDIYETALLKYSDGGLNQRSLISTLASERNANPNLSLQERLQKQFDIVDNLRGTAKTDDEKSIADRRIIALTQGLNPNQLTNSEREKAAIARENEAVRLTNQEKDAKAERAEDRKIQQQIADNTKRFLDLAEKEGLKAVLEIVDKTGGGINLQTSPTNADTQNYYNR